MALNPQFPNYANGPAGTEVIGWTVVGGQPLYRLPVAYVDTGFGAAYVCEGSTVEAPTFPEGVYDPDPNIESAGTITGIAAVGQTLTFTPGSITGTAPITATYNWIRYIPGGTSVIVGTGLSYAVQSGDITHDLIVQTVASNSVATVATQTVPYGPAVPGAPVITDAGSITSIPPNPAPVLGSITNINVTSPGANYIYAFGATRNVTITGDGAGATATAALNPVGNVVALSIEDARAAVAGGTGTVTLTGEGSEVAVVATWITVDPTSDVVDPSTITLTGGTGWTQANLDDCIAGTYGTLVYAGTAIIQGPTYAIQGYVGCPIASVSMVTNGSGYNTASATVDEAPMETGFPTPAVLAPIISSGSSNPVIYFGQVASYSGATVTGYSPQVSWVWGYGPTTSFQPIQLGGNTYRIKEADIGKEIYVQVTATNTGGSDLEYSDPIVVDDSAPTVALLPRIGPQDVNVGDRLTGQQGRWYGYPTPQVTDFGFAEFLLPTPAPIPSANKVYTYVVPPGSEGKRFCFYVTATNSAGTTTAYSLPTDPVFEELTLITPPKLTGFQSPAQYGDSLTGTPAVVNPGTAVLGSFFAYANPDGTYTPIAGTGGLTTYTLGTADIGKSVVYATTATIPGKYGPVSETYYSNATGVVRRILRVTAAPTITWSNVGPAPLIGATATITNLLTNPALGYPNAPGANPRIGGITLYVTNPDGSTENIFTFTGTFTTNTNTYVIPASAYGGRLGVNYSITYNDGVSPVTQLFQYANLTPAVVGTPPNPVTSGTWDPANLYTPGNTLTYIPGTYTGVPTPTVTWTWRRVMGDSSIMLQNGGLTYALPTNSSGWDIFVEETATNLVASVTSQSTVQNIGGPLPYFTRMPVVSGSGLMTPSAGATLNGIFGLASDPVTGLPLSVTTQWMIQYPGSPATEIPGVLTPTEFFSNENGKWTGAQVFLRCSASNAVGTTTVDSNKVLMVGTPRIVTSGNLGSQILPNRFYLTPCNYDGGGQPVTSQWSAEVRTSGGSVLAQIFSPATSSAGNVGTGLGNGAQTMTNTQGTTTYTFPQINVQFL